MRRFGSMVLLITAALAACSSPGPNGTGGSSSSSGTTTTSGTGGSGGATTSSSSGNTGGGGATSSSSAGGGGSGGGTGGMGGMDAGVPGYCAPTCKVPADCCLPNEPNCPSDKYPTNYTCDNGLCGPPQCQTNEDCTAGGQLPQYHCGSIDNGFRVCLRACMNDAQCPMPSLCTGVEDDMSLYCKAEPKPFLCTKDADCSGAGKCNVMTGACYCLSKADCTSPYAYDCVSY